MFVQMASPILTASTTQSSEKGVKNQFTKPTTVTLAPARSKRSAPCINGALPLRWKLPQFSSRNP